MYEYTLVHMLHELLFTEALPKSSQEPSGQTGFQLGGHSQGRFKLGRAEKFTELEEHVEKMNQQRNNFPKKFVSKLSFSVSRLTCPLHILLEMNQHRLVLHGRGMVPAWPVPPS